MIYHLRKQDSKNICNSVPSHFFHVSFIHVHENTLKHEKREIPLSPKFEVCNEIA